MKNEFAPGRLDVAAFAHDGATLEGREPLDRFDRLLEEARGDAAALPVTWQAQGELRKTPGSADQVWLHLQAHAQLPLTCQRCLEPVDVPVDVDRSFRFVADEATALAEDDEAEEDLLVLAREFDLHTLVEDELLMALPPVPRHASCPMPAGASAADQALQAEPPRPNPFAALAQLKVAKTDKGN